MLIALYLFIITAFVKKYCKVDFNAVLSTLVIYECISCHDFVTIVLSAASFCIFSCDIWKVHLTLVKDCCRYSLCRDAVVKMWLYGTKTDATDVVPQCALSVKVNLRHIENSFFDTRV